MNEAERRSSPEPLFHLYNTLISGRPLWPLCISEDSVQDVIHRFLKLLSDAQM